MNQESSKFLQFVGWLDMIIELKIVKTMFKWGFAGGWAVKNLPAVQETQVQSLGQEDSLEEDREMHCILAWEVPWTEEPGGLQSMGLQESKSYDLVTKMYMDRVNSA